VFMGRSARYSREVGSRNAVAAGSPKQGKVLQAPQPGAAGAGRVIQRRS
jgi:hypothetical protein